MEELVAIPYSPIPKVLYHYTEPQNIFSILSGKGGKDKEICFWANSNLKKNDIHELEYGKKIYDIVKAWLKSCNKEHYLDRIIDERNSFSLSFTEDAGPIEMINKYGSVRLEFDLSGCFSNMELMQCEYCEESEIREYGELIINEFKSLFKNIQEFKDATIKPEYMIAPIVLKGDGLNRSTVEKIFFLKGKDVWGEEKEWRKIYAGNKNKILYRPNNVPYIEVYLPINCLKSIRLFNLDRIDPSKSSYQYKDEFEEYLTKHSWHVPVVIENL